MNNELKCTG